MVIAYSIIEKNPNLDITYEPDYKTNGISHPPDLRIQYKSNTIYVQIKRLRKSINYLNNFTKYSDDNTMIAFDNINQDNINQIVGALDKAAQFIPRTEDDTFLIIQLVSNN